MRIHYHKGLEPLALGHEVRLLPPAHVKPYVKRGKTDGETDCDPVAPRKLTHDAGAICEEVTGPTVRYAPVKSREQRGMRIPHNARDLLVTSQTPRATSCPRVPNRSATDNLPR